MYRTIHDTIRYTILYYTVLYSTLLHYKMRYYTILYYTTLQSDTIRHCTDIGPPTSEATASQNLDAWAFTTRIGIFSVGFRV